MLQQLLQSWMPFLLLLAAWLAFGIYVRRKTKDIKTPVVGQILTPSNSITLARRADSTNILRSYEVLIDGNPVGTIGAGSVAHFPVEAGPHTVAVRINWCKCPDLHVEKHEGEHVLLWCGATYNDWRCTFMGFLQPKKYVYVRPPASDA